MRNVFRRRAFPVLGVLILPAMLAASEEGERLYRLSLDAYLMGHYDQAIVLAAQSLQVDPQDNKSRDLLAVLVAEKERSGKSEVWITAPVPEPTAAASPEPSAVAAAPYDDTKVWEELRVLREDVQRLRQAKRQESAQYLLKLFEQRVEVVAGLLEKSATAKVEEVRREQERTAGRLDRMAAGGTVWGSILSVLSLASLALSVVAYRRRGNR
jgi:hypothetical protein